MNHDVYAVGNALVDIQAQVSEELLTKLAFEKGIMTLVDDERQAGVLSNFDLPSLNRCAGGSAANTIAAVADFGGKASFVGKIGNDETGEFFLKDLRNLGVTIDVDPLEGAPTGTCAILITDDAERTMLTNLGASSQLSVEDIDEAAIAAAKYIYIEGYLFTGDSTKAAAYRAMELAKKNNVKVAFTASDPFLVNMIRDEIWDLIRGPVDLFFCNEEEAQSLTGLSDPIACASKIHESAENVAMTLGENGSILMHGGEAIAIEGVSVKAVDTTGAGDMYAGGVLYGITNGLSWKQAGHLGSHAAARVVSQLGARLATPFTKDEVQELTNV
ncbi:adenosine kinase [Aporhodopirellula aestuarii]|uniref:adenosine kinase n=1 Tax=Aporhodopirellula aestuarii TaxID=2950107 RepID=A0ABT0TXB9_9BACT|nr:adenosine kinase [Aporhodopirellula aestuarii]MCM2369238.1 adenosine kinase [Aporhodopirellula aestuarii]